MLDDKEKNIQRRIAEKDMDRYEKIFEDSRTEGDECPSSTPANGDQESNHDIFSLA